MTPKQYKRGAYFLFALCWLVYMASYVSRFSLSTCLNDMVNDNLFDLVFGGSIATGFFIVYGSGQLANGMLGDRIPPKYMIFTGALGSGICTVLMGFSASGTYALVMWCLNGFFQAMLWAPTIRCCSEYIPREYRKVIVHLALTSPIGMILSYQIARICLKYLSWKYVFFSCGIFIAASSVLFAIGFFLLRPYFAAIKKQNAEAKSSSGTPEEQLRAGTGVGILRLFVITGLFFTLGSVICNGIIKEGINTWIPTYMSEAFSMDSSSAANITSFLPFVNIFGAYSAERLNRRVLRNELATTGTLYTLSFAALFLLYTVGRVNVFLSIALFALSTSAMIGVNTMCLTYIPLHFSSVGKAASVTGILDAFAYLAAAGSSVLTGAIAEHFGWNGVILLWLGVSLCGVAIGLIGKRFWNKGKIYLET